MTIQPRLIFAGACAAALGCAPPAFAQPVAPLAPGAGALIIDQQRQDRQPPAPPPSPARTPSLAAVIDPAAQAAPTVTLQDVRVAGADRFQVSIKEIAAPYIGKPMTAETIRAVADAVSAAYGQSGLALYTIAAPSQDLSRGVLVLVAIEGHVAEVSVEGDSRALGLVKRYADELTRSKPLRKAELERYLSLIRDIPGVTADIQIYTTATPGAVRLAIKVTQKRFQPLFTFNNRGTPRLGSLQVQAAGAVNSLIRAGDQARLTVALPTDIERFQYVGASYATPIGSEGLTATGSLSYLRTRPENPPIDGDAVSAGLQLSYPLIRAYRKNLYISGGIDGLDSDNAIYGLSVTSDHTRALRAGLTYSVASDKRSVSASVTGSQGIDILGARADTRLTDATFSKLNLQLAINQAVGSEIFVRLRGLGQASRKRLPAAEQLPIGGETVGRAFYQAALVGDYGYGGSAELGWASAKLWPAALKGSEIYGFIDGARTWTRSRLPFASAARYDLASAGAGFRLNIAQKMMLGLEGAKAIDAPYPGQGRPWRVIISWRTLR